MRCSISISPVHRVQELVDIIIAADELGYHCCYGADQMAFKDQWSVAAAAASLTRNIRFSPGVTHVILRDPAMIAQAVATLDELSNGRAGIAYSVGEITMLKACHAESRRGVARLREAYHVMRTLLDTGQLEFEGEFYRYSGLDTAASPVQDHVPIMLGAMRSPKAMELAGEISDGLLMALRHSRAAIDEAVGFVQTGSARAGRELESLDLADILMCAIAEDRRVAIEAARATLAIDVPSLSTESLEQAGIDPDEVKPIVEAVERGDLGGAARATSDRVASAFTLAGDANDWIEHIRREIEPTRLNHLVLAIMDPVLVDSWAGLSIDGLPTMKRQLELISEQVIPALSD